ncbi:MAG: hypothetical protein WKF75_21925, partial [Singulisphaera sp.]
LENVKPVYDLLHDLGFRTTKSIWPLRPPDDGEVDRHGSTCADSAYAAWHHGLQGEGFEIGYHLATGCTSPWDRTRLGLERFRELFGPERATMSNHMNNQEGIYFGADRLSGSRRLAYKLYQNARGKGPTRGHVGGDPLFWGDLCSERVEYVRNFVFPDINALKACPVMPYHDPARPYVAGGSLPPRARTSGSTTPPSPRPIRIALYGRGGRVSCIPTSRWVSSRTGG